MGNCAEREETAGYGAGWKEEIGLRLGRKGELKVLPVRGLNSASG